MPSDELPEGTQLVESTWEGETEYRVLAFISTTRITLTKWSRRRGRTEWLPENQIISVRIDALNAALRKVGADHD